MFCRINFRLGVHTTIPLYMDVTKAMSAGNLEPINMVISASQLTPVQLAISELIEAIGLVIAAQDNVDSTTVETLNPTRDDLVIAARNSLPTQIRVREEVVEQIGMVIAAYEAQPDLFIDAVKDSVLRNNLVISANDNVEVHPTIRLEEINNDLVIGVDEGVELGPIRKTLGELSHMMELNMSKRIARIRNWDDVLLEEADEWQLNHLAEVPFDVALAVSVLEDDESGKLNLVIQACDDTGTVLTHPVTIGSIDPTKIGDLDPYTVPDATTE